MIHIQNIKINSFRGLKNLSLKNSGDVNLIVGENNTGKTSILEAIHLLEYPLEMGHYLMAGRKREGNLNSTSIYDTFINMFEKTEEIEKSLSVNLELTNNTQIGLQIKGKEGSFITPRPHDFDELAQSMADDFKFDQPYTAFKGWAELVVQRGEARAIEREIIDLHDYARSYQLPQSSDLSFAKTLFISPLDHLIQNYSAKVLEKAIMAGEKANIVQMLKIFDKAIVDFEFLPLGVNRSFVPYIGHSQLGLMPLSTYGDGVKKALTLAAAIVTVKEGVLLIDEIETGVHANALKELFQWFVSACKAFNVQVFATTHSLEAIDAILDGGKSSKDEIVVYRLEKYENVLYTKRFSGDRLLEIRYESGLDVR